MNYLSVPKEVSTEEMLQRDFCWSPSMYRRVTLPTSRLKPVADLLQSDRPFDKGSEPGSKWYLRRSDNFLIRTKALQESSYLVYPRGDAYVPVNPRVFVDQGLAEGDILMSKDSNVGECALVDAADWSHYMFSSGIVRVRPSIDPHYLFAFLKHPIFKVQLVAKTPRGATIAHAGKRWLDCQIPFPNQSDSDAVISYISSLTRAVAEREHAIRRRNAEIDSIIAIELEDQPIGPSFSYSQPSAVDIAGLGRLDAAMYSERFKRNVFPIENYRHGCSNYEQLGFEITRGQNLQVSAIGRSIYSDTPKASFYRLVAPTDISEFRTVRAFRYLGNRRQLSLLQAGDVVFGAEGFCKGRVVILADEVQRTISNIHGIVLRNKSGDLTRGIFVGCFLGYLRAAGIVDAIGAGGSGGSLAIGYFHLVPFPNFPVDVQEAIAVLYSNPAEPPNRPLNATSLLGWHREWNQDLGIWELDRELKVLQQELREALDHVILGEPVAVPK